jgi:uncharacterized repeat protein (TIGR03803 family)
MQRKGPSSGFFGPMTLWAAISLVMLAGSAFGQKEFVVHTFAAGSDGASPYSTLLADGAGNLYGTTYGGGASCGSLGCGTVYKLTAPVTGSQWTESVIYAFTGSTDGGRPVGGLAFDQAGNLYGTTTTGGSSGNGTVFQLVPPASGSTWTLNVIHNLSSFNNGYPIYPALDKFGDVYIEEPGGGTVGQGLISQIVPPGKAGGAWRYKQLYAFRGAPTDGSLPIGTLVLDKDGNLYGVTANGGSGPCGLGCGMVFELVKPATKNGTWTETQVYNFQGSADGSGPYSGVIFDNLGNLYGTTQTGGESGFTAGFGTVYELSPPSVSGGAWTETVLYSFTDTTDGEGPRAALIRDSHGNLYGTTITPTVFELSPPTETGGAWTQTTLDSFASAKYGAGDDYAGLAFRLPKTETIYGATVGGGQGNHGVVFSLTP